MGILNVTPDSFSDGGRYFDPDAAIAHGLGMIEAGASIVDVGGESTRPGATPVDTDQEAARIVPVIAGLSGRGVTVSVDTRNASTMAAALNAGAAVVNDVSGLRHDPAAAALVAERGCPVVLMHMRGTPTTMGGLAEYGDVCADVVGELASAVAAAEQAGIARRAIAIDPGFGFAKTPAQSTTLLRGLDRLRVLGLPIVAGVSRKRFIGVLSGVAAAAGRDAGSLAAGLFALQHGATVLRVHDVAATVCAVRVWQALDG